MNKYFYLIILTCAAIILTSCKDEESATVTFSKQIKSSVTNYNGGEAQLNIMGYFVEPQFNGTIDTNGQVTLNLPTGFNMTSQKAFTEYNSQGDASYELSAMGIEDIFSPLENLEITGDSVQLALAGKYYGFELYNNDDIKVGRIFPSSSKKFMLNTINELKNPPVIGYYYMLLYSSDVIKIKGSNEYALTLDDNGNVDLTTIRSYNISMKEGWNAIKFEVKEVAEDQNKEMHITESAFSSVKISELGNQWIYFPL